MPGVVFPIALPRMGGSDIPTMLIFARHVRNAKIPPVLLWLLGAAGCLALACILSRGTDGGDEKSALIYMSYFQDHGWEALRARFGSDGRIAHRLFWTIEKIVWSDILKFLPGIPASGIGRDFALALDGPLFMVAAYFFSVRHLCRRGLPMAIGLLAPAALLVASSGVGLFTGGFSECAMCLLVVAIMALLDREKLCASDLAWFSICGFLLIAAKIYATPFMLILTLLPRENRRGRLVAAALFLAAPFAWHGLESTVQAASSKDVVRIYAELADQRSPASIAMNAIAFVFSLSFGLLPCFPLLLFAFACPGRMRRGLIIKLAAISAVSVLLLSIKFWAGQGGLGGPRYIVPFLLILIPEIATGMVEVSRRHRPALLAVPLLAAFFLPALEYRNSLIPRYATPRLPNTIAYSTPHDDITLHPAVFGWRVLAAKLTGAKHFRPGYPATLTLATADIFPMTSLSRARYLLDTRSPNQHRIERAPPKLFRHRILITIILRMLAFCLLACLLGTLTWAALSGGNEDRQRQ